MIGLVSRKPLTAAGAEVRDHLKGLKEFIEWAEADRIRMLQSPMGAERVRINPNDPAQMLKLYEVLLPYAVVFGQEKQWAEELAVLYGPGELPGLVLGLARFQRRVVRVGDQLAVREFRIVVVDIRWIGRWRVFWRRWRRWRRRRGLGSRSRTKRRQDAGGTSQGRSERLPTGPCPLHQECPAITCGRCHSKQLPCLNSITSR